METNPENVVMPARESGTDLQVEYSEYFSSPLLGKTGEIQAGKESY